MHLRGISISPRIGVGDTVQFSSVPENYFRQTGEYLIDIDRPWIFDHNPYVVRDDNLTRQCERITEMWNFSPRKYEWPVPREEGPRVYTSNAELHACVMGVKPKLIRPRLYRFEDFPFEKRTKIYLHVEGKSHGTLPAHIIKHVIDKYKPTGELYTIGKEDNNLGVPHIFTNTLWDLAELLSEARMLIGSDSGPSWIAACYPDVIIKKVRMRPGPERLADWVPMAVDNLHSHWDDRCFQYFNPTEDDIGAYASYRRM